jgi:hypothetical protein
LGGRGARKEKREEEKEDREEEGGREEGVEVEDETPSPPVAVARRGGEAIAGEDGREGGREGGREEEGARAKATVLPSSGMKEEEVAGEYGCRAA